MATRDASTTTKPADHESALDHWRWLQVCLHSLTNPGWERRLHPLAQQMVAKRLVRARTPAVSRPVPIGVWRCRAPIPCTELA